MHTSAAIIRAICESYTVDQLKALRARALAEMAKGSAIVSVTSGVGQSYTRQLTASPEEIVEICQLAIERRLGVRPDNIVETFVNPLP